MSHCSVLAIESSFSWLLCHSIYLFNRIFFFLTGDGGSLSYFLALQVVTDLSHILIVPASECDISPRITDFFNWMMVSEIKFWLQSMLCHRGVIALRSSRLTEQRNICVCANLCKYTYIYKYLSSIYLLCIYWYINHLSTGKYHDMSNSYLLPNN